MAHVLLIITGSIAAIKTYDIIRQLKAKSIDVTCVLTRAAEQFVTPLSLASLSGNKVYTDMFSLTDEIEMGHIQLSRMADLVVVAPASADSIGKLAQGLADDLASTLLLATDKKVLIAPAMNVRMWEHPAVQRNVARIQNDGAILVEPVDGDLACGETGKGRMAEPEAIVQAITAQLR